MKLVPLKLCESLSDVSAKEVGLKGYDLVLLQPGSQLEMTLEGSMLEEQGIQRHPVIGVLLLLEL